MEVAKFFTAPSTDQRDMQKQQTGLNRFRQFYDFAGELIPFSKRDMEEMRRMANAERDPGLTILGFKPRNSIPFYHSVSVAYLIYPNDEIVQGSREGFAQLHAAMLRKNVVAIGEALHRSTWQSRLVAIYPLQEVRSEDMYLAPSMMVTQLPFEDDMRAVLPDEASKWLSCQKGRQDMLERSFCSSPQAISSNLDILATAEGDNFASEELVSAAVALMERQDLPSVELGLDFENAAMTEFYSYLKSIAFNTPHQRHRFDTQLDEELVLQVAKREIDSFAAHLPADIEKSEAKLSRKRPRDLPPDDSCVDWKQLHEGGKIGTCKIDQLKKYLRSVGKFAVHCVRLQSHANHMY
jgi:Ku70/Ku80 beta-barrel domain